LFHSFIFLIWNFCYIGLRFSSQIYRSISYPGQIWRNSFLFDYCKTLQSHILRKFNICLCRWRRQKSVRHLLFTWWSCTRNSLKMRLLIQIKHVHFLIKLLRYLSRAAWHFVWKIKQTFNTWSSVFFCFFLLQYLTLHTKITYYLQCQRNLQFNDNYKTYNTNIIYDFNNLRYNNILHYNLLISFM